MLQVQLRVAAVALAAGVTVFGNARPAAAQSEATIRGRVVAAADGLAVAKAAAVLTDVATSRTVRVESDDSGRFTIGRVRPAEYRLSVTATGFAEWQQRFVIEPREVKALSVSLVVAALTVSVDVTAAPPGEGTHSPSSTVVSGERLARLPASLRGSLPDAFVTASPGMIRGHDDFVHVRGHEVALNPLVNGVSFWENTHAVFSPGLDLGAVDSANVMTGGFPAEYGNRFGGVVDLVTKSGFSMDDRGRIAFTAGQAGRLNTSAETGGHGERFGFYLSGSVLESDRFLSPPDPEALHDQGRTGHAFGQLDFNLADGSALRVIGMGDGTNLDLPQTPADVALRPAGAASQQMRQQTLIVGWTRAWGEAVVSATLYQRWSRTQLFAPADPLSAEIDLTRALHTFGGKVDVSRFAGRHALKFGADLVSLRPREDLFYDYAGARAFAELMDEPPVEITDNRIQFAGRDKGGQVSVYAQDTILLGDRLTADLGLRLDRYSLEVSATHLSPRANLAFRLSDQAILHASYNRFFVPPAVEGVLSSSAGLTERLEELGEPLPPVQPTTEDQFEGGASTAVGPVHLAATAYYRASDNPVHTTVWPDARIYSYASFTRARAYGLEIKADVTGLSRFGVTGHLNYALGRVYFYNPATGGFVTEAEHLEDGDRFLAPMDQTHTLSAGATYRHERSGAWAGLLVEYGSGTPTEHDEEEAAADAEAAPHGDRVPAHTIASLSFGVDLWKDAQGRPRFGLQLDIENVGGRVYLIAQESEFAAGQFSIPRLVSLTARIRF